MSKYNIVDRAKFTFYQIPKLLIHGEKYKSHLSSNDILAYSILMDRLNISIKNNWYDENGDIYFVYSNDDLMSILNISTATLSRVKKRLEDLQLLKQERTGRGNRLYLLEPQVDNVDEAKYIMELDQKEIEDKSKYTDKDKQKLQENLSTNSHDLSKVNIVEEKPSKQPSSKNEFTAKFKNETSDLSKLNTSNKNLVRSKDFKDSKESAHADKTDTDLITHSFNSKDKNKETEDLLINAYIEEYGLEYLYGTRLIQQLKTFSFSDLETFKTYVNKVAFALKSVEKEHNTVIPMYKGSACFDFMEECLVKTFHSTIQQHRFGKVNNIASYLFISFKQVFVDYVDNNNPEKAF